ncbi:glycosyltransferase [Flavihumibacter stibioxidans]|nr:glycosyltransferase [Flavihumibacter stibioxidans]
MITLAYFIDPFLEAPASLQDQAFLDAIPDLAARLPDYRHIALTTFPGISLDAGADSALRLTVLPLPRYSLLGKKAAMLQSLRKWLAAEDVKLFFTSDPELVFPHAGHTLLVTSAAKLLQKAPGGKLLGKKNTTGWMAASRIIVPHEADRTRLLSAFPGLENKIKVIYPAFQEPVPSLGWSEQEQVKLRYSGGRDYLIFAGALDKSHDLVNLLRSYSLFKKWLMTGMPIILAGPATDYTPEFEKLLESYKYNSDVSLFPNPGEDELKEMLAGAYALVWPAEGTNDAWPIEWAFHAGTPVISTDHAGIRELCSGAALLSSAGDLDQMAQNLMILYKDEHLRARLIEKGRERALELNRETTLNQYANSILELCGR